MRGKFFIKIKMRFVVAALCLLPATIAPAVKTVEAARCPDVRLVFARGSGGERWEDANYLAYKTALENKLMLSGLSYEFIDLDYPAVGIGLDKIDVALGALMGSGDAYEFGESVKRGVKNLDKMVNNGACVSTKYVIGGYSQGAMVVSKALPSLRADRIVYAATFGDPKIYLPEGKGVMPAACRGANLSDYRMYVPDCRAYKGLLGAYIPYEPAGFVGKVGTWCNKRDVFCSSHLNVKDHVSYIADNLYEDASRVIYDKICQEFGIENTVSSPHDTAILIDSTGSMARMIDEYKNQARVLAERTLAAGGRVALYDYRDYQDGYVPRQRCSFEACDLTSFEAGLEEIVADGGTDTPESLLASSFAVMQELNWKIGSTKSIVVLTDAGYHEPDFDLNRTTRLDVVALSKQIDPVNFYIVTTAENTAAYADLVAETDGRVATTVDELTELTDYILRRYDSLPRVEESFDDAIIPTLAVESVSGAGSAEVLVKFTASSGRALVILNDAILGVVEGTEVTITGLDMTQENFLQLVPLGDDVRGEAVEVNLAGTLAVPKAPNTGKN